MQDRGLTGPFAFSAVEVGELVAGLSWRNEATLFLAMFLAIGATRGLRGGPQTKNHRQGIAGGFGGLA